MKSVLVAIAIFSALIMGGFAFGKVPQSYSVQQKTLPLRDVPIVVSSMGPYEYVNGMKSPTFETLCIRATGECRKVLHPALHQKLVTFCRDPEAPGGVIFYVAGSRWCKPAKGSNA